MKKEEKRKKYILKLFKDYSNEELLEMYKEKYEKYILFKKTSKYVKEILKSNNKYYLLDNSIFINEYYKLIECIQYRNLKLKVNNDNTDVSINDIRERLKENMLEESKIIEDNNLKPNNKVLEMYNQYANIFKDLKEGYLLIGTLDLFNAPGFVFPIFKKDNKYYFECAESGEMIDSFYEISKEEAIKMIKPLELGSSNLALKNIKMIYNVGDIPIAAYLYNDMIFISDTNSMMEYVDSLNITNEIMLREIETFKEDVKEIYEKRKKYGKN